MIPQNNKTKDWKHERKAENENCLEFNERVFKLETIKRLNMKAMPAD